MPPEVKFCGLTRPEDARVALDLGAAFVGVILAGGPRHQTIGQAAALMQPLRGALRRVAVVGDQPLATLQRLALLAAPDVLQLHASRPASALASIRAATGAAVWVVLDARDGSLPAEYDNALRTADGILLDSLSTSGAGGTGVPGNWERLARSLEQRGRPALLVLAGGLRPDNLAHAIATIAPDVVDVSSGVERTPGVKDHRLMAAFCQVAVSGARPVTP